MSEKNEQLASFKRVNKGDLRDPLLFIKVNSPATYTNARPASDVEIVLNRKTTSSSCSVG